MQPTKETLRHHFRERREALPRETVARCSHLAVTRLRNLTEVVTAPLLALYAAFAGEIDLTELISDCERQGKGMLLPRHNAAAKRYEMVRIHNLAAETVLGHYGILEPDRQLEAMPPDLLRDPTLVWLVPGVLFDVSGNRIGQGGGFYDRLLCSANGLKIGVGYDWQVIDHVPVAQHDVPMDLVATDVCIHRGTRPAQAVVADGTTQKAESLPSFASN